MQCYDLMYDVSIVVVFNYLIYDLYVTTIIIYVYNI